MAKVMKRMNKYREEVSSAGCVIKSQANELFQVFKEVFRITKRIC